jgi:hypothetical protein
LLRIVQNYSKKDKRSSLLTVNKNGQVRILPMVMKQDCYCSLNVNNYHKH